MTSTTNGGAHAAAGTVTGAAGRDGAGERSTVGELFSAITSDLSTLVRQEIALAKAEATQSATKAGKGAGLLAGAGVSGHFVLLFLSIAVWWALGEVTGRGWSALVVAVVWAVIAAVLAAAGRRALKTVNGLPATTESLGKVPAALKGHEEENHR